MSAAEAAGGARFAPGQPQGEALATMRAAFVEAGLPSPALDARLLVAHALGIEPLALLTRPEQPIGADAALRLADMLARRTAREPVARIIGMREFWGLPFRLSPGTLEPRPATETVLQTALDDIADRRAPLRVLDLGTGSGCLLAAALSELPHASGIGVDVSLDALLTARANAAANGVGARAAFAASEWAAALAGRFDLVLSNPPYIPSGTIAALDPEVARYDPLAALDGGPDGLGAYRALLADLPRLLSPGGRAVFEVGHDQADAVAAIASAAGLRERRRGRDLDGHERALALTSG